MNELHFRIGFVTVILVVHPDADDLVRPRDRGHQSHLGQGEAEATGRYGTERKYSVCVLFQQ